jgi:hypothetical protein
LWGDFLRLFIIDGSCREIAMGAGIVEIDGQGFMNTHKFNTYHLRADATLAEIFAFDCAMQIIQEKGPTERHFEIYTDHMMVYKLFQEELGQVTNDLYVDQIKKQVGLLKKFTKFEIQMKNDAVKPYMKIAHLLSRDYLEQQTTSKIINQSISLQIKCV